MNTHGMGTVNRCFEERRKVISHMLTKKESAKVTVSVAELWLSVKLNDFLITDQIFFLLQGVHSFIVFSFSFQGNLKTPSAKPREKRAPKPRKVLKGRKTPPAGQGKAKSRPKGKRTKKKIISFLKNIWGQASLRPRFKAISGSPGLLTMYS